MTSDQNFELADIYDDTDVDVYRLGDEAVTVLGGRSVCVVRPWKFLDGDAYPEAPEAIKEGIVALHAASDEWSGNIRLGEIVMWSSRRSRRDDWFPPCSEDAPMFVLARARTDAQAIGGRVFNRRLIREALQAFIEDWEHGDASETIRCSIKTLSNGAALALIRNRVRVFVMCLSSDVEPGDERMPTEARCHCQWEAGDSPCPMHGMDEEEPVEDRGYKDDREPFKVEVGAILRSPYRDNWRVVEIMSDNMVVLESDEGATIERPIDILRRWWSGV